MEKNTNEKSLAVVDYNVFAKLRRFFINIFNKKQSYNEEEVIKQEEKCEEETAKTTRKLFNYDAEVDDIMPENITEKNIINDDVEVIEYDDNNMVDNLNEEVKSKASEEKEELERKLMNYYASIKNNI